MRWKSLPFLLAVLGMFVLPLNTSAKEGFYIGIGIGGGWVFGGENVETETVSTNEKAYITGCGTQTPKCASTDFGDGMGALFRMGYNILSVAAIEVAVGGTGGNFGDDNIEGQGGVSFNAVIHPVGIAQLVVNSKAQEAGENAVLVDWEMWDPYVFIGGGFGYGGYTPPLFVDDDEKGWSSTQLQTGLGMNFHLTSFFSAGIDLRWTFNFYDEWIFDWEDNYNFKPIGDPSTVIFTPQAVLTFHFN